MERGNPLLRFLDQFLGPILVALLALLRRRSSLVPRPQHIGLIKAAALGDTVLVSALVSDLKRRYPEARISLFAGGSNLALAERIRGVDRVQRMPLKNPWAAFRILRGDRLDLIIDTDAWPRISALWAALSGAYSVGFRTSGQRRHYAFDVAVPHRADVHELENYRALIKAIGVDAVSPPQDFSAQLQLAKTSAVYKAYREFRKRQPSELWGLHLWPGGTKSHLKEWPTEFWRELMQKSPGTCVFVMTGAPADRLRNEEILQGLSAENRERSFNAAGCSLDESIQILAELAVLVSVNTGILHLGAAVGCPVVGLHGPTNPRRWGPVGAGHLSLVAEHPAAGCLNLGFEYPEPEINVMPFLSVERVLKAATDIRKRVFSAQSSEERP